MTTIAWDGKHLAADTLAVDPWGLKVRVEKIMEGTDFILGASGEHGNIMAWWRQVETLPVSSVIHHGYTHYEREHNCPNMILVTAHNAYRLVGSVFVPLEREFFAVGSGRDFAITAMHLGKSAEEAVKIAALFDNNTGTEIQKQERPSP